MKTWKVFLGIILVICFYGCEKTEIKVENIILDIPNLIQKSPAEVVTILGEPDTVYYEKVLSKTFLVQRYRKYDIEIQYLNGKSNDIIINEPQPVEFNVESLNLFGINPALPTEHREKELIKWKNYSGLKTINFYKVRTDSAGKIINFKIYFKADQLP